MKLRIIMMILFLFFDGSLFLDIRIDFLKNKEKQTISKLIFIIMTTHLNHNYNIALMDVIW